MYNIFSIKIIGIITLATLSLEERDGEEAGEGT